MITRQYYTDLSKHRYPGIARAALEMAYDNGGVNRDRPERVTIKELDRVLENDVAVAFDLQAINDWLAKLDDEQLNVVVAGEESEAREATADAPAGTDALLNAIFDYDPSLPRVEGERG